MAGAALNSLLGPEFDTFLFAPIGAEENGMSLSVLSALARLDIDPWQEAAELARLPVGPAIQKLASLIAGLPGGTPEHLDPRTIAARLIALLPRQASANISPRETLVGVRAATKSPAALCAISCVLFMAFMLGTQFIVASRQMPAQMGNPGAPVSSAVSTQTPPPPLGR